MSNENMMQMRNTTQNPFTDIIQQLDTIGNDVYELRKAHVLSTKADPEQILTATQAAELLQVSLPTFREWDKRGYLARRTIAGEIRYLRSEIIASLQKPEVSRVQSRKTRKRNAL